MKSTYSKIYSFLSPANRRRSIILLGLIIIGMLFEILGIGLLVPVILLLMDDNLSTSYPVVQPLLELLGNPNHKEQIYIILMALISIFFIKNTFLAFIAWREARFITNLQVELSDRLFSIYLRQPYTFHLQRNSAQLIRNISGDVSRLVGYGFSPVLNIIAEILVLIGIAGLLLIVELLGTIIVFLVLFLAAGTFYLLTRSRVTYWGQKRQYHDGQRIQHLNQVLGGAKDVIMLGRQNEFITQYQIHNTQSAKIEQFLSILNALPRLWLELLAVVGLVSLVFIMLFQGKDSSNIVPAIGLFAAAAFRLMPSVIRILNATQSLRFGLPVVDNLYNEFQLSTSKLDSFSPSQNKKNIFKNEICLSGITFNYPDTKTSALSSVSINIQQGQSIGFIGPSGSGKSTILDVILGLLKPEAGIVLVDGVDIQEDLRTWQDQIGYVSQSIYLTDDTLRKNIAFGLPDDQINDELVLKAIQAAQLNEYIFSLPDGIETVVGERGVRISGGQKQRIGIARALYHDPDILVLDEATSALDTATEQEVMKSVMALHGQKTVIIVAHRLSTVAECDMLYRMEHGKIVEEGVPSQIIPTSAGDVSSGN